MKDSQPIQLAFNWEAEVKPRGLGARVDSLPARQPIERPMFGESLMEEMCERGNMRAALQQVRANQGSPGIDDMRVDELPDFLKTHWLAINADFRRAKTINIFGSSREAPGYWKTTGRVRH